MSIKKNIERLKSMGFNVMPLKPFSKSPLTDWKRLQTEMYSGNYPDNCNIAVICGKISGNIFVIDIDEPSLYKEFEEYHDKTYIVQTGKRGFHIYLRSDTVLPYNKKLDDAKGRHIDIKSEGGYVLGEGSIHPDTKKQYSIICDKPVLTIDPMLLKEKLTKMGFNVESSQSMDDIEENGAKEGGRNNAMFRYACYLVREKQINGIGLSDQMEKVNKKNNPPLSEAELKVICAQAERYESKNLQKTKELISLDQFSKDIKELNGDINLKTDLKQYVQALGENRVKDIIKEIDPTANIKDIVPRIKLQDVDPKDHEGMEISFDATVMAVGEKMTFTSEADFECNNCGATKHVTCDIYHILPIPYCLKCRRNFEAIPESRKTIYIQQMRIREFLETARNNSPVEFDAEIIDENVGEAYMNDRMSFVGKFRSIPPRDARQQFNHVVFQILKMEHLDLQKGEMPSPEEIEKWKSHPNIYQRVVDSISPELHIIDEIVETSMLVATGGTSLNGKRARIHAAYMGDAGQGKSEHVKAMRNIILGSGMIVGINITGKGLTIGEHTMYNGTKVTMAGFLPSHTGNLCIFDEFDKMKQEDQEHVLEAMEQGTCSQAKTGTGSGITMPADCSCLFAGNPKNGKFNPNLPNIMDNFRLSTPFINRLDILWLQVDNNDADEDRAGIKHIRNYNPDDYMTLPELQRYFTYTKSLHVSIPKELEAKIDELYLKMRPLNKQDGMPIGWRQFYGLHRLVTAMAANHLRDTVNLDDFKRVEHILVLAFNSLKMDLEKGTVGAPLSHSKDNKETIFLETWKECMAEDKTVSKDEFLGKLSQKPPYYNELNVGKAWNQYESQGKIQPEGGRFVMRVN